MMNTMRSISSAGDQHRNQAQTATSDDTLQRITRKVPNPLGLFRSAGNKTQSTSRNKKQEMKRQDSNQQPRTSRNRQRRTGNFRVPIPPGVQPGDEFHAQVGDQVLRVTCPPNAQPGNHITIKAPSNRGPQQQQQQQTNNNLDDSSAGVTRIKQDESTGLDAYMVEIPAHARPGEKFSVRIRGQSFVVTCPRQGRPGMNVRIVPPATSNTSGDSVTVSCNHDNDDTRTRDGSLVARSAAANNRTKWQEKGASLDGTKLFEVELPRYVRPGHPFPLQAGGMRVLVNCPMDGYPGQRVRFRLPVALFQTLQNASSTAAQRLKYDKDGWSRTLRMTDKQFQWIRMDQLGGIDDLHLASSRFDPDKSAFCRKLYLLESSDPRFCDGILDLVSPHEALCESEVHNERGQTVITYSDLAEVQVRSFEDKAKWFAKKCKQLEIDWECGHMRMMVRRNFLIQDSISAIMALSQRDLRKVWRFEFIGEPALDAGGLTREWFQLVTSELFDPDLGFWMPSEENQMCLTINPASKFLHDDYLMYYRLLGRIMGKALFDHQLVAGHMAQFIYKHMLGWPITFNDLKSYDTAYHTSLNQMRQIAESGQDVEMTLCMDFTTTIDVMGSKETVDLIPHGADRPVTNDNYLDYMEVCLKYHLMDRVKPQLNELLLGFFDVIPEPLLTIFDFQELELLMCGLPVIDLGDWMQHTEYAGTVECTGAEHQACQWFWEVVYEFNQEMRARLLQFVTGTSGVPARGFGVLQGNDGSIRKFTINGVPLDMCRYPRAHTCFNRIDLPMYTSKAEVEEKLRFVVSMFASGFDIE